MRSQHSIDASHLFFKLRREEITAEARNEFTQWLARAPENIPPFSDHSHLYGDFSDADRLSEIDKLVEAARARHYPGLPSTLKPRPIPTHAKRGPVRKVLRKLGYLLTGRDIKRADAYEKILDAALRGFASREDAERWLTRRAIFLRRRRPVDVIDTPEGVELVITLLARIHYSVYT